MKATFNSYNKIDYKAEFRLIDENANIVGTYDRYIEALENHKEPLTLLLVVLAKEDGEDFKDFTDVELNPLMYQDIDLVYETIACSNEYGTATISSSHNYLEELDFTNKVLNVEKENDYTIALCFWYKGYVSHLGAFSFEYGDIPDIPLCEVNRL